jgi:hypothetical protein
VPSTNTTSSFTVALPYVVPGTLSSRHTALVYPLVRKPRYTPLNHHVENDSAPSTSTSMKLPCHDGSNASRLR